MSEFYVAYDDETWRIHHFFYGWKFKLLMDLKEDGGMGRETRGNFSDVEEERWEERGDKNRVRQ